MTAFACVFALAACLCLTARADDDPEPRGTPLRKLRGTWEGRVTIFKGRRDAADATYAFGKDTVTRTHRSNGKSDTDKAKLTPDKKRKDLVEMKPEGGRAVRYFYKIEKGELYLSPVRLTERDPKPDFSGNSAPVLILKREKK